MVTPDQISNLDHQLFPMSQEYLDQSKFGELYHSEIVQWTEVIDDDQQQPVIGIVCIMNNRFLPNSTHISVFEIPADRHNQGLGTIVLNNMLQCFKEIGVKCVTLQCREKKLESFYKKFGFRVRHFLSTPRFMRKYLTN
jgi:GNAT superfamily N-acetyltransferase